MLTKYLSGLSDTIPRSQYSERLKDRINSFKDKGMVSRIPQQSSYCFLTNTYSTSYT